MKIEHVKEYSRNLGWEMDYKVYGHAGKPMLIFPTSSGRFNQYEDEGMVEACKPFIEEGRLQIFTPDGIDWETFEAYAGDPCHRIRRHEDYYRYIMQEIIPSIEQHNLGYKMGKHGGLIVSGCSMGGFHSSSFFFRRPDVFDTLIALSGAYSVHHFFGEYLDELAYQNSPLAFLPSLEDEGMLRSYRRNKIIICCGQGEGEEIMVEDTARLKEVLEAKNIPAWIDVWGHDVGHDWYWWKQQIVYFLRKIL